MLPKQGHLLRIFIGERHQYGRVPLYQWIVKKARERGLAGATVLRGLMGFGAKSHVHTAKILRLSSDLPVVIEIVDTMEKIEAFLPEIDKAIGHGLATIESRSAFLPGWRGLATPLRASPRQSQSEGVRAPLSGLLLP